MIYDLQKASILKRISAALLDIILALIIATGIFFAMSSVLKYDKDLNQYNAYVEEYEGALEKYDIQIGELKYSEITESMYNQLSKDDKKLYDANKEAMQSDQELVGIYKNVINKLGKLINMTLLMLTLGTMIAILVVEFVIPLFLKNGQTIGKKMFGICLMMDNGVKVRTTPLFIRALLGKFAIETMIPLYTIILLFFGQVNAIVLFLAVLMLIASMLLIIINPKNALIHDVISYTVVVDKNSQMIFNNQEELIKYKEENAKKKATSKRTF